MEEKTNISILLKDCPSGMELNCMMFDDLYFDFIDVKNELIHCYIQSIDYKTSIIFDKYGCYVSKEQSKCVIFPKGKTTWEGFQRPFKDGDVVFFDDSIAIFKEWGDETLFRTYVKQYIRRESIDIGYPLFGKYIRKYTRFATPEEKQKLFDAIKANGYKWNAETKTLEELIGPKFKVGDWIEFKYYERKPEKVIRIENNVYWLSSGRTIMFQDESAWDLATKFDLSTLKPFEEVLVRCGNLSEWSTGIFSHTVKSDNKLYFIVNTQHWEQCIPYKGNEHLRGKTDACSDYFKTWVE